ncbi:glycosyltransferase family 2 protein [Trichocoleus sp. FACHB-90]|uniref:glycosyltransferase family 2 protein n=1 Tax=Funiculus sociatus TaxID=450527 RepID=UPI001688D360|nr:glycosyltransferase family 2 protein [Trichocoleus sp. FACHB-90]MBD1926946.1 glycosyltransferase family 2 protein [Trichocoleus sp. FACHB-90]
MKFSIVITTYNRLSLLRRAIDTALAQTLPCEVIVADDCSSDETEAYVSSLAKKLRESGDERLVYHRNSVNLGHSATMNAGVQLSKGEWVKPVDDDDYLAPNCLEEMYNAIALCPNAVICSCQAAQVDVNEVEITRTKPAGPGKAFYIPQEDIHYGMLLELVPFGTPIQVAFRRDAFLKSGGWDTTLDVCDDIDSWIRIAQFGDAVFLNQCLAYRTIWTGGNNQKSALQRRLDINILMKEKIYALVSQEHQANLPSFQNIKNYLKLHWSLVALKQKKILTACELAGIAVFNPFAWKLLTRNNLLSKNQSYSQQKNLKKQILFSERLGDVIHENYQPNPAYSQELPINFKFDRMAAFNQQKIFSAIKLVFDTVFSQVTQKLFGTVALLKIPRKKRSYQKQMDIKILFLYLLVSEKRKSSIPNLQDLQAYLELRGAIFSVRQGKIVMAIQMAFPSVFSLAAWKLLLKVVLFSQLHSTQMPIRKLVLIES